MSFSKSYAGRPSAEVPEPEGLVVPPDALRMHVVLQVEDLEPDRALAALRSAQEQLGRAAASALPGATVRPREFIAGNRTESKSLADGRARLDASLDLRLTAEQDFWARAALEASLAALTQRSAQELKRAKPPVQLTCAEPGYLVLEPERHRPELLRRWLTRARELIELAGEPRLELSELEPADAVTQRALSPTEVALSLPVRVLLARAK
jgi:hypothetical protein